MEDRQSPTNQDQTIKVQERGVGFASEYSLLTPQQQAWVDYCAVQGLLTDEAGNMKHIAISTFAINLGVHRDTLYDWKSRIPDFPAMVTKRRKEIAPISRVQKVWNGLYMRAATGDPRAAAIYLRNHDPDFKMPQHEVKLEAGGSWAKLLGRKRDRKVIESQNAKVIDAAPSQSPTADN
jgi:hypothetical protein